MMRRFLLLFLLLALPTLPACSHTPTVVQTDPVARRAWTAQQVVTRLGEFQNLIIDMQRANTINLADARVIVLWLSGDPDNPTANPGLIQTLKQAPAGWPQVARASWAQHRSDVAKIPELAPWLTTLDALFEEV